MFYRAGIDIVDVTRLLPVILRRYASHFSEESGLICVECMQRHFNVKHILDMTSTDNYWWFNFIDKVDRHKFTWYTDTSSLQQISKYGSGVTSRDFHLCALNVLYLLSMIFSIQWFVQKSKLTGVFCDVRRRRMTGGWRMSGGWRTGGRRLRSWVSSVLLCSSVTRGPRGWSC